MAASEENHEFSSLDNGGNSPIQVVEDHTGHLVLGHITDGVSVVAPTIRLPASYPPPPFSVAIGQFGDRVEYVQLDRLESLAVRADGSVTAPLHMTVLTAKDIKASVKQAIDDVLRNMLYGSLPSGEHFRQLRKRTTLNGTQWVVLSHDLFTIRTGRVLVAGFDGNGVLTIETQPKENFHPEESDLSGAERALFKQVITALLQGVPTQLLSPGIPSAAVGQEQQHQDFDDVDQMQQFFLRRIHGQDPSDVPNGVWRRGRHDIESRIRKLMCEHGFSWELAERIVRSMDELDRMVD